MKSAASRLKLHKYRMSVPRRRLKGMGSSRRNKTRRLVWQTKCLYELARVQYRAMFEKNTRLLKRLCIS